MGTAASATLALALLVCGCVFVAVVGPALSVHSRTEAFQQTFDGNPLGNSVNVSTDWADFAGAYNFETPRPVPVSELNASVGELGRALAATPLPIGAGAWGELVSRLLVVQNAAASAVSQAPPRLEVMYRAELPSYVHILAGSYTVPQGALGVVVTTATAARFGLKPGSRIQLQNVSGPVELLVTGIVAERETSSSFWNVDPLAGQPGLNTPPHLPQYWVGGVIVDPGSVTVMQQVLSAADLELEWEFPLDISDMNADQAPALLADLTKADGVTPKVSNSLGGDGATLAVSSPMVQSLTEFTGTQAEVETVLLLLFVSLIVIGAGVILLAARMIAWCRTDELAMVRSRGGSARQVGWLALRGAAVAVVPAAILGAGLAVLLAPHTPGATAGSTTAGWVLAVVVVAIALGGTSLVAAWQLRKPAPPANAARVISADTTGLRRPPLRRLVAEVTACAAAVAGLVVLHGQGVPAGGGIDLYLTIAPVLVAIPVVLILLRLYPLVMRVLFRLAARRPGATGFLALAQATRSSLTGVLPAFALMLVLSLTTFTGMLNDGVSSGQVAASWQSTGADVQIKAAADDPSGISLAAAQHIASLPGVRAAALVWSSTWETTGGQQITVLAVDPGNYAALVAGTPSPGIDEHDLSGSGGTISAIASPAAAALLGRSTAMLTNLFQMGPINVRVAGTVSSTPAMLTGGAFILIPLETLPGAQGQPAPGTLLINGPGINDAQLTAAVASVLPTASVTFRSSVLAALTGSPLQHGATTIMVLVVVVAAGFGLLVLILGLALGAAERQLTVARLATMGHERATWLILAEAVPAIVVAVVGGAACALALPGLIGSAIDLSSFTGTSVPVQLRPDLPAFAWPALALLVLAVIVLLAQAIPGRRLAQPRLS